jgi:hypothetical protein
MPDTHHQAADDLPLVHRPFAGGQFRVSMSLLPLDFAEWVEVDGDFEPQLREKRRLMAEHRHEVFGALPEARAASDELLRFLVENVTTHHSERFRREGAGVRILGLDEVLSPGDADWHPVELAGRLVQEDWCLLQTNAEGEPYRLIAATLCFPSRWRLHEKLGLPLADVHGPVPIYAEKLAKPVDRFFGLLKADKPVRRVNWSLYDDPRLFQPTGHGMTEADPSINAENAGERLWLRMERQTLVRLPETGAIVFGIRTHQHRMRVFEAEPQAAADLAASIRSMPPEMQLYKSIGRLAGPLLGYLDRIAEGPR